MHSTVPDPLGVKIIDFSSFLVPQAGDTLVPQKAVPGPCLKPFLQSILPLHGAEKHSAVLGDLPCSRRANSRVKRTLASLL